MPSNASTCNMKMIEHVWTCMHHQCMIHTYTYAKTSRTWWTSIPPNMQIKISARMVNRKWTFTKCLSLNMFLVYIRDYTSRHIVVDAYQVVTILVVPAGCYIGGMACCLFLGIHDIRCHAICVGPHPGCLWKITNVNVISLAWFTIVVIAVPSLLP